MGQGAGSFVLSAGSPSFQTLFDLFCTLQGELKFHLRNVFMGSDPKSHEPLRGQSKVKAIHKVRVMGVSWALWTTSDIDFQKMGHFPGSYP